MNSQITAVVAQARVDEFRRTAAAASRDGNGRTRRGWLPRLRHAAGRPVAAQPAAVALDKLA